MNIGLPEHSPLGSSILAALRRSCEENKLDVAEHLINGLEVLAKDIERHDPEAGRMLLNEGYRAIAKHLSPDHAPLRRPARRSRSSRR